MKQLCSFVAIAALILVASVSADTTEKEKPAPAPANQPAQITPGAPIPAQSPATAQPTAGEQIKWQVISGGGTSGSSTNYKLAGTVGQTAAGLGASTNYKVNSGYWQNFTTTSCCTVAGDANNDNSTNVGDAVYTINHVFKGGPAPTCKDEGDANFDCRTNVGDAVYLINHVFKGGAAPQCGCVGP